VLKLNKREIGNR